MAEGRKDKIMWDWNPINYWRSVANLPRGDYLIGDNDGIRRLKGRECGKLILNAVYHVGFLPIALSIGAFKGIEYLVK